MLHRSELKRNISFFAHNFGLHLPATITLEKSKVTQQQVSLPRYNCGMRKGKMIARRYIAKQYFRYENLLSKTDLKNFRSVASHSKLSAFLFVLSFFLPMPSRFIEQRHLACLFQRYGRGRMRLTPASQ